MARMTHEQVEFGVEVPAEEPTPTASVEEALDRAAGHRVLVEAHLPGVRAQAHRRGDEVTVFGADGDDAAAVREAVASFEVDSVIVDAVVAPEGVRFTDLLWLNGRSWMGRPTVERLDELAEVAPVAYMIERISVEVPAWATVFIDHIRQRGVAAVSVRLADAPRGAGPAGAAWQVVDFAPEA